MTPQRQLHCRAYTADKRMAPVGLEDKPKITSLDSWTAGHNLHPIYLPDAADPILVRLLAELCRRSKGDERIGCPVLDELQ
jgi:hypothetical protein